MTEVPVRLPRRRYALARRAWHRSVSPSRHPGLPFLEPPGGKVAARITAVDPGMVTTLQVRAPAYVYDAPAEDFALELAAYVEGPEPSTVTTVQDPPHRAPGSGPVRIVTPPPRQVTRPDVARFVAAIAPPSPAGRWIGQRRPNDPVPSVAYYPTPARVELVGALAIEDAGRHGAALLPRSGAIADTGWWTASSWAAELVTFVPPLLWASFKALSPAVVLDLGEPRKVLIADPHPWIPVEDLPPAAGSVVRIPLLYDGRNPEPRTLRPVLSRYVVFHASPGRHELHETGHGLLVKYTHRERGNLLSKLSSSGGFAGDVFRAGASTLAGEIIATAAGAVVGLGAGAGVVQAALAGARHAGLDLSSAIELATATGPAGIATEPAEVGNVGQRLADALIRAAPDAYRLAPVVAPEETEAFLIEVARGSVWLAGFDGVWGRLLRESVLLSIKDPLKRNRIRLELGKLAAEVARQGGMTLAIAKALYDAVASYVVGTATGGLSLALEAGFEAAQQALDLLLYALETRGMAELRATVEAQANARAMARLDELLAAVAAEDARELEAARAEGARPSSAGAADQVCGWACELLRAIARVFDVITWRL